MVQGPVKSTNINHSQEEAVGLSTSGQLWVFTLKHFLHALCFHPCTPETDRWREQDEEPFNCPLLGPTLALSCLWSLVKEYHFPSQHPPRAPLGHPLNAHRWPILMTVLGHWWSLSILFSLNTLQHSYYCFKTSHLRILWPLFLWCAQGPLPRTNLTFLFRGDWIRVGLCYPRGTTFSILSDVHNRLLKQTSKTGTFVRTLQMDKVEQSYPGRSHYYWDEDSG